jgi:hypothetical protein
VSLSNTEAEAIMELLPPEDVPTMRRFPPAESGDVGTSPSSRVPRDGNDTPRSSLTPSWERKLPNPIRDEPFLSNNTLPFEVYTARRKRGGREEDARRQGTRMQ